LLKNAPTFSCVYLNKAEVKKSIPGKLGTFLKYDDVDFIIKELKHNFLLPKMQKKQTNKQNHGKYSLKSPHWNNS